MVCRTFLLYSNILFFVLLGGSFRRGVRGVGQCGHLADFGIDRSLCQAVGDAACVVKAYRRYKLLCELTLAAALDIEKSEKPVIDL
mgnify:CR=1 FL=1